jgi:hypothetical protein
MDIECPLICTSTTTAHDIQRQVLFNKWDIHELVSTGKRRIFFWNWEYTPDPKSK